MSSNRRTGSTGDVLAGIGLVAVGIFLLAFMALPVLTTSDATCGGKQMSHGDTCVETHNGLAHESRSADEQKTADRGGAYVELGLAVAMILGGGFLAVASIRTRS